MLPVSTYCWPILINLVNNYINISLYFVYFLNAEIVQIAEIGSQINQEHPYLM